MANLGKIIADFSTTLNLKVAVWATSATLDSATDDDWVSLPAWTYFFTIDANNSSKEYIKCTLSGTAISSIQSYSRQGALTSGFARTHRKGAIVKMTDFGVIKNMIDMLDDTTPADLTVTDLDFSGTTTGGLKVKSLTTVQRDAITPANGQIIYNTTAGEFQIYQGGAWSTMASGSTQPNASTTVAGKKEDPTDAESIAGTDVGGTGATMSPTCSQVAKNIQSGTFIYGTDAWGDDTYVVALTPTLAAYTAGQTLFFKPSTTNTGACTVDFWPWVKNIKTKDGNDPQSGVIRANMIVEVFYDGTNFVLATEDFATTNNKGVSQIASTSDIITGTSTTLVTNVAQLNERVKKIYVDVVPAGTDTSWTGTTTLYTTSIPANTFTADSEMRFYVDYSVQAGGAGTYVLNIKFGGVTLWTLWGNTTATITDIRIEWNVTFNSASGDCNVSIVRTSSGTTDYSWSSAWPILHYARNLSTASLASDQTFLIEVVNTGVTGSVIYYASSLLKL